MLSGHGGPRAATTMARLSTLRSLTGPRFGGMEPCVTRGRCGSCKAIYDGGSPHYHPRMRDLRLRLLTTALLGTALAVGVSCSGGDDSNDASGGSSSSGGAAASGGSGSDSGGGSAVGGNGSGGGTNGSGGSTGSIGEPTPGVARGAISLHIPSGCSIEGGYIDAPVVSGGHPVSSSGATQVIADGDGLPTGGANVTCRYLGNNPLNANVALSSSAGGVSLGLITPLVVGEARECTISVSPAAGEREALAPATACSCTALSVDGSAMLLRMECESLTTDDGSMTCALAEGFIYFDGCE